MKSLTIKNLVLIEEVHINFQSGFTVITGETGAGKTALIEAIRLLIGERADGSKLRKGCEKGVVQGVFEFPQNGQAIFDQAGLLLDPNEDLIITRELSSSGKSRAFVCGQQVPLTVLHSLGPLLVDFIGQHAAIDLKSSQTQRRFLDLFASVDTNLFSKSWNEEKELNHKLEELQEQLRTAEKQKAFLQAQFDELLEADVQEGEFESLFDEYELLSNSQETLASLHQLLEVTEHSLASTRELKTLLSKTAQSHSPLAHSAHINLSELYSELQKLQGRIDPDPQRLIFLEERLKQLNHLKKKYGTDVLLAKKQLEEELESLHRLNETIEEVTAALHQAQSQTSSLAKTLTEQRTKGAIKLAERLTKALHTLNMPHALFGIDITPAARTSTGEDEICFWLQANPGEKPALLRESTSGGELSRLFFCLKTLLATGATMVFDEIDANVGGETATVIGKKLKDLGLSTQVLSITHFPQVARQADHHIRVFKEEKKDRTVSRIDLLSSQEKETELSRMLGGLVTVVT